MVSDYTPTTEQVCAAVVRSGYFGRDEVDRWLAQHDAEVKGAALRSARDEIMPPYNCELRPDGTEDPRMAAYVAVMHDVHGSLSEIADRIEKGLP